MLTLYTFLLSCAMCIWSRTVACRFPAEWRSQTQRRFASLGHAIKEMEFLLLADLGTVPYERLYDFSLVLFSVPKTKRMTENYNIKVQIRNQPCLAKPLGGDWLWWLWVFTKSSFCFFSEKWYLKIGVGFGHKYKLESFLNFRGVGWSENNNVQIPKIPEFNWCWITDCFPNFMVKHIFGVEKKRQNHGQTLTRSFLEEMFGLMRVYHVQGIISAS